MGMHSSINELYTRANMVILNVRLNCRSMQGILNTCNILSDFVNTIEEVIVCACSFWELDSKLYQIVDEKNVTLSNSLTIREIYTINGGVHKLNFELVNKYTGQFEILKSHLSCSKIDGQASSNNLKTSSNPGKFQKVITISKQS